MQALRKLASQTVVYGLSSILGRFLNYLLVPLYTYTFPATVYGVVSEFYAYAGFFAVTLVLGLETGYFRFRRSREGDDGQVFATSLWLLILANLSFVALILAAQTQIAAWLRYPEHPEYLLYFALILAFDAIAALPFARLRAEQRAWTFAGIKLTEILLAIALNLLFLLAWPKAAQLWPDSPVAAYYRPEFGVGYIFLANLLASGFKLLLLLPSFKALRLGIDRQLLRPLLAYSLPMVAIGLAGMVNEMLDRAILKYLLPYDTATNLRELGIYGACYKLSILMSLFVQAFRYAGEPFFFAYAGRDDAPRAYALVMKYFVIFCVFIFLLVTLFLDIFQLFIGPEYRSGLDIVPILLMANLCLGIYVNLSVWFKLTDRTGMGAWVSLFGAILTVGLNLAWIPSMGYRGAAWATLICYAAMTTVSYLLGRRYYPVPYPLASLFGYVVLGLALFALDQELVKSCGQDVWLTGAGLLAVYLLAVALKDVRPLLKRRRVA